MQSDRRYNEEELRELMRRATEKQRAAYDSLESGLSLEEIKRIAAEVGVDPSFVELAAKELGDASVELKRTKLAGAPLAYRVRRSIPGELKDRTMADIAAVIPRHSKQDPGHVKRSARR